MQAIGVQSDRIPVVLEARAYGTDESLHQKFFQETSAAFLPLGAELEGKSVLLRLVSSPTLTKKAIFDAYGKDLALLKRYQADFEECMMGAVQCSIITRGDRDSFLASIEGKTKTAWQRLKEQVPVIGKAPLLELSHIRAAKDTEILLPELQEEFQLGVQRLLKLFTFWLQMLVEAEFVGLVEWTAPTVCRYHYFRHEFTESTIREQNIRTHSYDGTQEYGERNSVTTTRDRTVKREQFLERHVHNVVESELHGLTEYQKQVPARIAEFLGRVPSWLRPLLRIVDGQITMEEVIRLKVADQTTVESEIVSVYKYSPGVLLGQFNLVGWSGDDLWTGSISFYEGQSVKAVADQKEWRRFAAIAAAMLIVLGSIIWTGYHFVQKSREAADTAYAAYVAQNSEGSKVTNRGDVLYLSEIPLVQYGGTIQVDNSGISLTRVTTDSRRVQPGLVQTFHFKLPTQGWSTYYGEIDLAPDLGIFAKLHVLSATPEAIRYKVVPYADGDWNKESSVKTGASYGYPNQPK